MKRDDYQALNRYHRFMKRDNNVPERAQPPDPPDTPTDPATMEPGPVSASANHDFEMSIQKVAPDYKICLITLKDRFGIESRWMVPGDKPLDLEEVDALFRAHVAMSQGVTRRN